MNAEESKTMWDGLRELVGRLRQGRYWTDRRDACEELASVARQAIFRLRQAAEDPDPDVAHWGRHACQELGKDFSAPVEEALHQIDAELAHGGLDPDSPPAELAPSTTSETFLKRESDAPANPGADPGVASPEALLAWLADFAKRAGLGFMRKGQGASLNFALPGERKQTVFLDLARQGQDGQPLALFYSICGEAPGLEAFQWALQANCALTDGAFGVIQHQDRNVLIMTLRWPLRELPLAGLEARLRYLAEKADWAEARLQTSDEH